MPKSKIKGKDDNNKISSSTNCININPSFDFGNITNKDGYSITALYEVFGNDKTSAKSLMNLFKVISESSWVELQSRNKQQIGGYELLESSIFKKKIWEKLPDKIFPDTKLYVFRFGSGDKYRVVGFKPSDSCKFIIKILGFDLDYSLYNHE